MVNTLLEIMYILCGLVCLATAYFCYVDSELKTKIGSAAFWVLLAFTFIAGPHVPPAVIGVAVVLMGVLTATKQVNIGSLKNSTDAFREEHSLKLGNQLFIPALAIAVVAFLVGQFTKLGGLVGLGFGAIIATIIAMVMTKAHPKDIPYDGSRLLQQVGAVSILPQLLAALGALFSAAGVGQVIADGISGILPQGNILAGVIAYCVGMALFTMIMGNAFAAFAVITAGIGIPFVYSQGANPWVAGALALTAGYCGTLMTPMAANFNIVPAAILETKNKNRVIISQVPVAIAMLIVHIILMYFWAF
mgnify:CR=1 FL=1